MVTSGVVVTGAVDLDWPLTTLLYALSPTPFTAVTL